MGVNIDNLDTDVDNLASNRVSMPRVSTIKKVNRHMTSIKVNNHNKNDDGNDNANNTLAHGPVNSLQNTKSKKWNLDF
jgi:hypothetical protein